MLEVQEDKFRQLIKIYDILLDFPDRIKLLLTYGLSWFQ